MIRDKFEECLVAQHGCSFLDYVVKGKIRYCSSRISNKLPRFFIFTKGRALRFFLKYFRNFYKNKEIVRINNMNKVAYGR